MLLLSLLLPLPFALLVALVQVIQQYFATAQNMRKCDDSVFGATPGKSGRRTWTWQQFRFRIVYDMPKIFVRLSKMKLVSQGILVAVLKCQRSLPPCVVSNCNS